MKKLPVLFFLFISVSGISQALLSDLGSSKGLEEYASAFHIRFSEIEIPESNHSDTIYIENESLFSAHGISREKFDVEFPGDQYRSFEVKEEKKKLIKYFIEENSSKSAEIDQLFTELGLMSAGTNRQLIKAQMDQLVVYCKLNAVYHLWDDYITRKLYFQHLGIGDVVKQSELLEKKELIEEYVELATGYEFAYYGNNEVSSSPLLGVSIFHDNDVFAPLVNEDRNYTGGGELEIYTDYFKMRFFSNVLPVWRNQVVSYQGIFYGAKAYTPFIRYPGYTLEEKYAMYADDRPFGSFEYFGRAKYWMQEKGKWRARSALSVGTIGGEKTNVVQSIIHRDQVVGSIKVEGWETQIANGGRFSINYDARFEHVLHKITRDNFWVYPTVTAGVHVGNFLTAADVGFSISNLKLIQKSGHGIPKLYQRKLKFICEFELMARYVQHNTMLEDFGIFKTYEDDPDDDEPISMFVLESDQVNRWLLYTRLYLGLKMRKTTIRYDLIFHSNEYQAPLNEDKFYGWGTLGLSFDF